MDRSHPFNLLQGEKPCSVGALVFLIVAIVAGLLGFVALEGTAMWNAKVLFVVFLVLLVISLVMGRRPVV